MWLDDVHIPWERVFLVDPSPELIRALLFWHQFVLLAGEGGVSRWDWRWRARTRWGSLRMMRRSTICST